MYIWISPKNKDNDFGLDITGINITDDAIVIKPVYPINMKFEGFEMIKFCSFNCLYYYFLQLIFFSCVSGLKEVKSSSHCCWIAHYRCVQYRSSIPGSC